MIKKLITLLAFATGGMLIANEIDQLTLDLRKEAESNSKSKVKEETHPILYGMISDVCKSLEMPIPKSIRIYKDSYITELNAFVTPSEVMRIGETLIKKLSYNQLKAVIAHEISHIKLKHGQKRLIFGLSGIACYLALNTYMAIRSGGKITTDPITLEPKLKYGSEISPIVTGLISNTYLISLLLGIFKLARYQEKEADLEACKAANPKDLASTFAKFGEKVSKFKALSNIFSDEFSPKVKYLYKKAKYLFSTHPSHKERIKYLNEEAERQEAEFRASTAAA